MFMEHVLNECITAGMSFTPENMLVLSSRLSEAQRVNVSLMQILDRFEP